MPEVVDESVNYWNDWFNYLFVEDPLYRTHNILNKDFIRKKKLVEMKRERTELDNVLSRAYRPLSYVGTVQDNSFRLFALACLERFVTLRQAYSHTSTAFAVQGHETTLASTFNELRGNVFRGLYRGTLLNFFQWTGTYYNALVMSGGNSGSFLLHLLFCEALFHPVDTLRTRYVADGCGQYKNFVDAMRATKPNQL